MLRQLEKVLEDKVPTERISLVLLCCETVFFHHFSTSLLFLSLSGHFKFMAV